MPDLSAGIFAAFAVGIGGALLYGAAAHHRKRVFLRQAGLVAVGVIIRLEEDDDPESSSLYPVVKFTTLSHEVITVRYPMGSYPAAFYAGQQVQVLYDPSAPREFVIGSGSIDVETIWFGLLGAGLLGFGLYCCLKPYS